MHQTLTEQHCHFSTHDNVKLFYRYWSSELPKEQRRGAIVLFHRGHEHSGRMAHLVSELGLTDFDVFAWDARGHGQSPGARGDSPSFATSVRDVQTFIRHLSDEYGWNEESLFIIAQSVGAVLISTWVHDYAPRIRGMALASPAFKVKLYVPFARQGLGLLKKIRGNFFVNSYVKSKFLTHDISRQQSYDSDPLISRPISVTVLLGLYEAADRIVADAHAIVTPTILLTSESDWVVHQQPQIEFFNRLSSTKKSLVRLSGFYHDTLGEKDRHLAIDPMRKFILDCFSTPFEHPNFQQIDQLGHSVEESKKISTPLSSWSPSGLYWALGRLNIKLGSLLSVGLQLGRKTGFDSGSTLDYVYRNQANGRSLIGRLIDRHYLNAIGWKGIRQRKVHIEELLQIATKHCESAGMPLRLIDIAAGHGRYVLDAVKTLQQQGRIFEKITLRDYSDINVRDGKALIEARQLSSNTSFLQANAFDEESIANTTPKPSIGIVSGLYELFPENTLIRQSLRGMASAIPAGGYLVYTNQPWHPQLELIARTLTSHREGKDWVMRRRTQAEMDDLVREAGFVKLEERIDEWGIFTVCLAQRSMD